MSDCKHWDIKNLENIFAGSAFVRLLEITIEEAGQGHAVAGMPIVQDKHTNLRNVAAGGSLTSLADTAMQIACATLGKRVITIDMSINFIQKGPPGRKINAVSKVLHEGVHNILAEADIMDEELGLLAKASGAYLIID